MNVIIFANGEQIRKDIVKKVLSSVNNYVIIACDGATSICKKVNVRPDYIIGDFDSYSQEFEEVKKIKVFNQNLTDLQKALNFSKRFVPENLIIFSAFGKRLDHSIANLMFFYYEFNLNANLYVYDNFGKLSILYEGKNILGEKQGSTISLFSFSNISDIKLTGFKYSVEHKGKLPYFISISNEINNTNPTVYFSKGKLICYIPDEI